MLEKRRVAQSDPRSQITNDDGFRQVGLNMPRCQKNTARGAFMPEKSLKDLSLLPDQEPRVDFARRDRRQKLPRFLFLALNEKTVERVFQAGVGVTLTNRERV